jgi:hypothetical protein
MEADRALEEAGRSVAQSVHPIAIEVGRLLAESDVRTNPALIRALAAVATHVDGGEVLAARVFSSRYLGDSKALDRLRGTLERRLGSLEALGIRKGAALCLLGGKGSIHLKGCSLTLDRAGPFLGVTGEVLERMDGMDVPAGGVLVVENLTVFEACCRLETGGSEDSLILWSGGYPGRAVRKVVRTASEAGHRIRVWADLDLDGVRITRLLASECANGFVPYRMGPEEVLSAPVRRPLTVRSRTALRADLKSHPMEQLAETLQALLENDCWIEQEALLAAFQKRHLRKLEEDDPAAPGVTPS